SSHSVSSSLDSCRAFVLSVRAQFAHKITGTNAEGKATEPTSSGAQGPSRAPGQQRRLPWFRSSNLEVCTLELESSPRLLGGCCDDAILASPARREPLQGPRTLPACPATDRRSA